MLLHIPGEIGVFDGMSSLYDDEHPLAKSRVASPSDVNEGGAAVKKASRIRREELAALDSHFKEDQEHILALIEGGESDTANKRLMQDSLRMIVSLIPVAENAYRSRPSQSNAYALNSYLSSSRELIADLEAMDDRGAIAERITNGLLFDYSRDIMQQIIYAFQMLPEEIAPSLSREEDVQNIRNKVTRNLRGVAQYIEERRLQLDKSMQDMFSAER